MPFQSLFVFHLVSDITAPWFKTHFTHSFENLINFGHLWLIVFNLDWVSFSIVQFILLLQLLNLFKSTMRFYALLRHSTIFALHHVIINSSLVFKVAFVCIKCYHNRFAVWRQLAFAFRIIRKRRIASVRLAHFHFIMLSLANNLLLHRFKWHVWTRSFGCEARW